MLERLSEGRQSGKKDFRHDSQHESRKLLLKAGKKGILRDDRKARQRDGKNVGMLS
jgi:hypothetical protein